MEYKEKPFSNKMNFLRLDPNFKYLGGIGEKKPEYKRIIDDDNSVFEDESIRKKVKNSNVELTVYNAIDDFHKTKLSLSKDKEITKPLIEKMEEEQKSIQNESIVQKSKNQIGKISGITKNNIN